MAVRLPTLEVGHLQGSNLRLSRMGRWDWVANVRVPTDVMAAAFRSAFAFKADIRIGKEEGPKGVRCSHAACSAVRHQRTFGRNHWNDRLEPDSCR